MDSDSTTLFPPGTDVIFIRSTKEPAPARVIGFSECGDEYRHITYRRRNTEVQHDAAPVDGTLTAKCVEVLSFFVELNARVCCPVPPPLGGNRHLATVPPGVGGDRRAPGGYCTKGGEGMTM